MLLLHVPPDSTHTVWYRRSDRPPRVLVVDTSDERRTNITRTLREGGCVVFDASSEREARRLATAETMDLVILDAGLPDTDGIDACRRMKSLSPAFLPVLRYSSHDFSLEPHLWGTEGCADGFLAHPFSDTELHAAVSALVRLKRQESAGAEQATTNALLHDALDSLADHVALLGPGAEVLAVNRAWLDFARENSYDGGGTGLGANYIDVCARASGPGSGEAQAAASGIGRVLAGEIETFSLDYPCHCATAERWFRMTVRKVTRPGTVAAIVTHTNRTDERVAERAAVAERAKAEAAYQSRATEERLFRALTEQSLEFVSILEDDGRIRYVSPSVRNILGYAAEALTGTYPVALVHPDDLATMTETYFKLSNGGPGTVAEMRVRLRHNDGSWRYFEGGGQNLLHDPAVHGITSNARDVTARIEAERERMVLEDRFRRFVETAHEVIWAIDANGITTYTNPRIRDVLGCSPDDAIGRPIFDFMSSDSVDVAKSVLARHAFANALELDLVRPDGTVVHTLGAASPFADEAGNFDGCVVMMTDITERKRSATAMAEALHAADLDRRRLEATLRAIPVGVWIADANGRITHTNPAAEQIWGGRAPHPEGPEEYHLYRAWVPGSQVPLAADDWSLSRVLKSGEPITGEEIEIERFDGTRAYVLTSAAPIVDVDGRSMGGVVANVDISEQHEAVIERERLLDSLDAERTRLATVFELAPAFLAVMRGPDHIFERINPAYQSLVGDRSVIGKTIWDALPEIRDQGFEDLLTHVRLTGEAFVGRRVPIDLARTPGAPLEKRYLDFVYQRLAESDGNDSVVAHGVDVTDQVVAAQALRATELQLRQQFAKMPVPTFLLEARGDDFVVVDFNDAAAPLMAALGGEVIGRTADELYPQQWELHQDFGQSLRDDVVLRRTVEYDTRSSRGRRTYDVTIGPQQPNRIVVHAVDVSEKAVLEEQLRQAQKMEAVGRLAGGVAHDFNNLLTVIEGHSSFLLLSLADADPRRADAEAIQAAGARAAQLTRQLLAFSRKQILRPTIVDLNAVVVETQKMLSRLLGEDIEMQTELTPHIGRVLADAGQLEQVLMNLALNARDAMPHGGRLTIATRMEEVTNAIAVHRNLPAGRYAVLMIRDSGIGMDTATQRRVFEPFFTTKEVGKGTGLGLATVYGIVNQSGGFVFLESEPGLGALFEVYLPAVPSGWDVTAPVVEESDHHQA